MSRTKPVRVMRRTTSLSSEMEMVFTTMSLRQGKSMIREDVFVVGDLLFTGLIAASVLQCFRKFGVNW